MFELEAVFLDEVERIVVSYDNKGFDLVWYLDKVIVRLEEILDKDYRFNCGRFVLIVEVLYVFCMFFIIIKFNVIFVIFY